MATSSRLSLLTQALFSPPRMVEVNMLKAPFTLASTTTIITSFRTQTMPILVCEWSPSIAVSLIAIPSVKKFNVTAVVVHRHFRSLRPASPLLHLPCRLRPTIGAPLQTPITRYVSAPLASSPTKDSPFISTTCRTNVWVFEVEFSQMEHLCRCMIASAPKRNVGSSTEVAPRYKSREPTSVLTPVPTPQMVYSSRSGSAMTIILRRSGISRPIITSRSKNKASAWIWRTALPQLAARPRCRPGHAPTTIPTRSGPSEFPSIPVNMQLSNTSFFTRPLFCSALSLYIFFVSVILLRSFTTNPLFCSVVVPLLS